MITFLWMLYLAFIIFFTTRQVVDNMIFILGKKKMDIAFLFIGDAILSILWSIWYIYFSH